MKVLIISNLFYPYNHIGSFRIEAFAKYFQLAGHSVTVVTEGKVNKTALWNGCEIHYITDPLTAPSFMNYCIKKGSRWSLSQILIALLGRITSDSRFIWRLKDYFVV